MSISTEELPAELRLLIDAVKWRVGGGQSSLIIGELDEQTVLKLAIYHGVAPWLWVYTKDIQFGSEGFRTKLAGLLREQEIRNKLQRIEAANLSNALNTAGIPHLVFKGLNVEAMFYRGFVGNRYSDDIDMLIKPKSVYQAAKIIAGNGYVLREPQNLSKLGRFLATKPNLYRWRDIGFKKSRSTAEKIDLHWRIADSFTLPVSTDELLSAAIKVDINDGTIPCLPFSVLFVYVCVHGHTDYFFRLRSVVDIYCAMRQPEFDFDEIMQIAASYGVEKAVENSIATVNKLFSSEEPDSTYADFVVQRYQADNGMPGRSHPNTGDWNWRDKWRHFYQQTQLRSRKSSAFAPLIARFKYNRVMVERWPEKVRPELWYPMALLGRFLAPPQEK